MVNKMLDTSRRLKFGIPFQEGEKNGSPQVRGGRLQDQT